MLSQKKTTLIILDGWGHGDKTKSDAIHQANTPFINSLYTKYPNSELETITSDTNSKTIGFN